MDGRLRVRLATAADAALLAALIDELNEDQKEETGRVSAEAIRRGGFGARPEFRVLLADLDGAPAGYALFHPSWSKWMSTPAAFASVRCQATSRSSRVSCDSPSA